MGRRTTPNLSVKPWAFSDIENPKSHGDRVREAQAEGRAALKSAETAARRNDFAAAKKWTDVAKRMG